MTTTPHKHAKLIKAWADGAMIQHFNHGSKKWKDCDPQWASDAEYRVKPAEIERVYPETKLTHDKMLSHWYSGSNVIGHEAETKAMYRVANAALRDAIDKGQVLDSAEFNRLLGDRRTRDMAVARAVAERSFHDSFSGTDFQLECIITGLKP